MRSASPSPLTAGQAASRFNSWIIRLISNDTQERVLARSSRAQIDALWPLLAVPKDWRATYNIVIWDIEAPQPEIVLLRGNPVLDPRCKLPSLGPGGSRWKY